MIEREPSRTAFAAASYRAVHQVLEGGRVFSDKLAVPILGVDAEALRPVVAEHEARRGIRFFVVARARLAEDAVLRAVKTRGVRQLVVLGAGLDTFGYRHAFGDRLSVFEVDHPARQAWKLRRLGEADIEVPASLVLLDDHTFPHIVKSANNPPASTIVAGSVVTHAMMIVRTVPP